MRVNGELITEELLRAWVGEDEAQNLTHPKSESVWGANRVRAQLRSKIPELVKEIEKEVLGQLTDGLTFSEGHTPYSEIGARAYRLLKDKESELGGRK